MPAYISGEHQILMPTPCSRWIVLATALFVGCMPTEDTTQTTSGVTQQSNEPNSAQSRLMQDILVSGIPSSIENSGAQIIIEARDEVTGHLAVFKTSALNGVFELDLATLISRFKLRLSWTLIKAVGLSDAQRRSKSPNHLGSRT